MRFGKLHIDRSTFPQTIEFFKIHFSIFSSDYYTDLTDGSGQIIVMAMNKVSEKQLLASVEKLEIKISQLIQEKEKLSKDNQSLSKKNDELVQTLQSLESLKDQARVKAENVLRSLEEIEPLV